MACIYVPTKVLGGFKIFYHVNFYCSYHFFDLFFLRSHIAENWDQFKCNPMIIPFADMFGFDSNEVLSSCIGYSARKSNKEVQDNVDQNLNNITNFLNEINEGIDLVKLQIGDAQGETEIEFSAYFDKLNNTTSTMEYLGIKVKTIFYKITAVYTTLLYAAYAMIQGVNGIVSDKKLQDAINIIIDPGKVIGANKVFKQMKKFGKSLKKGQIDKAFGTKGVIEDYLAVVKRTRKEKEKNEGKK